MKATSKKRASWKQILNKVHDFKGNLTEQFPAFKEWLEKDWHCGPKRTAPTAGAGAENATLGGQPSTKTRRNEGAPCAQLQPHAMSPSAAASNGSHMMQPGALPPDALDALAPILIKNSVFMITH